ncbi:polyprenyl synthetase family protein [Sinimarinibacterium sp. NLF-5-8]|uniref:polyprenyl synthetase family protein n=1 Tax=Sinimarinibacterium sp. NLF-5-8 TaxID=2698684 RepID=UPI00137C0E59|nr:polyprenyl synthetase family protein [Sinimarinibacterium sp. NLF-5-8]QHS08758.1 octaprenyl diphosphate synthase [Sinimarinibacterium sp. NLF-5-8]
MNLSDILAPIAADMRRVDDTIRQRLHSEVALINDIGAHIVAAGGKRLRPALVLLSARALGCSGDEPILHAATIEFIHTATLLHDDVVDESGLRRGSKTANAVWGNAGAVLAGDFVYSRSFQMMVDSGRMQVMRVMSDTTNAVAEGEVLQLLNAGDPGIDEARYLKVIELKTARLFEGGCRLGAIAAEQSQAVQDQIAAYGHHLGIAFQIVDDLLDYLANPEISGKAIGGDLSEGKPTLPLIQAMKSAPAADAVIIADAIAHGRADQIDKVLKIVESTDAIPYTRALAEQHSLSAIQSLRDLPDSSYKTALEQLARFNLTRAA